MQKYEAEKKGQSEPSQAETEAVGADAEPMRDRLKNCPRKLR